MTPTEIRSEIARLVEAGAKATPGEWSRDYCDIRCEEADDGEPWLGSVSILDDGDFIVAAANCRPALSALAGCCVLDVEVVRGLIDAATAFDIRLANDSQTLAAAIAEVRRVESIPH